MMYLAALFLLSALTVVMLIHAIEYGIKNEDNTKETILTVVSFTLLNMLHLYVTMVS